MVDGMKMTNLTEIAYYHEPGNKDKHYLVAWRVWHLQSLLAIFVTFANTFLLFIFYSERAVLASSVNAMIFAETVHRILYTDGHAGRLLYTATLCIHWRTVILTSSRGLFSSLLT